MPIMKKEKLILKLSASALKLNYSLRNNFVITMTVTNNEDVIIEPELNSTKLLINGKASFVWMETVGNGLSESNWYSLPPGQTVSKSWATLGEQLFNAPGEYVLQLQLRNTKSEHIKIIVLND
jgi:hypothetical protein